MRVCLIQEVLPKYRVPLFDALGRADGIELELWAGSTSFSGALDASEPTDGFTFRSVSVRAVGPMVLQPSQLKAALGRFDAVILPWRPRSPELGLAVAIARLRGVRVVLWGHGFSKEDSRARTFLRDRLGRAADACVFYNRTAARRAIERGLPAERTYVALNAIDQAPIQAATDRWQRDPARLAAFRAEHDVDPERTVLFVSRLKSAKRVDRLLTAFASVVARRPRARLVVVGKGESREQLGELADRLGIADQVTFTGALYEEEDLAPWFLSAGVFAYPTQIGLSILHAFGYGLPVVTSDSRSDHGPEIEALEPGVNGLTYRDGDPGDLAARIGELLDDPSRRTALTCGARATVAEGGFTLSQTVAGFVAALRGSGDGTT